jgi:FixJ family two-component response regulator
MVFQPACTDFVPDFVAILDAVSVARGTRFWEYGRRTIDSSEESMASAPIPAARGSVLIVEDESELLAEMEEVLRRSGFAVEATSHPRTAIEIATGRRGLDVVVTDIRMPEIEGPDLIGILRARLPEEDGTQFIVVTGVASVENAVGSMRAGAMDFLCKPIGRAELIRAVDAAADRARQQRESRAGADTAKRLLGQLEKMMAQAQGQPAEEKPSSVLLAHERRVDAAMLRGLIKARARRDELFALEGEPSWDMLLDLASAKLTGEELSVTAVCIASRASMTTALRRLNELVEQGTVLRRRDQNDGRRHIVELSEAGLKLLLDYLGEVGLEPGI